MNGCRSWCDALDSQGGNQLVTGNLRGPTTCLATNRRALQVPKLPVSYAGVPLAYCYGANASAYAFDVLYVDGVDLRDLPPSRLRRK